jgi:hypothetical protein
VEDDAGFVLGASGAGSGCSSDWDCWHDALVLVFVLRFDFVLFDCVVDGFVTLLRFLSSIVVVESAARGEESVVSTICLSLDDLNSSCVQTARRLCCCCTALRFRAVEGRV